MVCCAKTIPQSAIADSSLYAREPMTHPDSAWQLRSHQQSVTVSAHLTAQPLSVAHHPYIIVGSASYAVGASIARPHVMV